MGKTAQQVCAQRSAPTTTTPGARAGVPGHPVAEPAQDWILWHAEHGLSAPAADRGAVVRNGAHGAGGGRRALVARTWAASRALRAGGQHVMQQQPHQQQQRPSVRLPPPPRPPQGNHIFTSGATGTNAAVIRGALRAENQELLTVVLPQSLGRQPPESQELLLQARGCACAHDRRRRGAAGSGARSCTPACSLTRPRPPALPAPRCRTWWRCRRTTSWRWPRPRAFATLTLLAVCSRWESLAGLSGRAPNSQTRAPLLRHPSRLQVICFAFHDSSLLLETCRQAKAESKMVTLFYLECAGWEGVGVVGLAHRGVLLTHLGPRSCPLTPLIDRCPAAEAAATACERAPGASTVQCLPPRAPLLACLTRPQPARLPPPPDTHRVLLIG